MTERDRLFRIHELRWKNHWGKGYDINRQQWPQSDAEWRQTPHGAPWDTNVGMAEWHLKFARELLAAGLLQGELRAGVCVTCGKAKSAHYNRLHCQIYPTYRSIEEAQAIEAGTAKTTEIGLVHESAVGNADASKD